MRIPQRLLALAKQLWLVPLAILIHPPIAKAIHGKIQTELIYCETISAIYIYDAGGNTYWDINNAGKLDPSVLTLVSSQDDVFGNEDDNTETASTAVSFLQALSSVYDYYNDEHNLNEPGFGVIAGIYNDTLGVYEGENAGGGILLVDASLPATPPDYSREDYAGEIGVIIMGSAYNDDFLSAMDSIGHEYTHFVTRRYVDWCHSFVVNKETNELYETYDENGAIDEALSDIFGELIEFDVRGETDWAHGKRTIYDPTINGYPNSAKHEVERNEKGWVVLGVLTDYAHGYSTVISHAAYLMWHGGEFLDSSKRLSETELAKLWYRAMLTMPSDCDFVECRTLVELAASTMGLTDLQMQCVSEAFDAVGIPRASENEYSQLVHLAVEGSTSIKGTVYEVKTVGGQETVVPVPKAIVTVYSGNSGKPYKECNMDNSDGFFKLELPAGAYSVVVSADGYIAETITLELAENEVRYLSIELASQSSAVTTGAYEAYLRAAQKTTASGSWSEKLSTTADMTLSKGSATTRTQTTLTSDAAISGYSEGDLSKLQISGSASMDAMGQTYAWTMEYSNGTAHYRYTEPVPTTAELEIDPNFFSFNTITSDMMTNAALSGNQITFVVPGEALTKAGLAAVDQMNGFDDLSYGDADVVVQLSTEGKIDTIAMAFHASMEYQGYDADMDFVINYGFSEYVAPAPAETVSITPGFYAQEDDPNNILTIREVSGSRVTFSVLWYRLWGINDIEATKSGNSASFHYTEPNNKELWAEGTLAFSEDTVVLTLTDCTNPYVDTGEYRFKLIGIIFSDEQLKEISYELGVPENLDTKITQGEPAYWEGGDMYRTPIEVYYNGEFIAGASVNSLTGGLAGAISVYDAASHSVSDSAGAFDIASTFGYSKAWEIHDYVGEDHMVTTLAFQEDGTFYGGTGWYLSDWFVCFTGTYSVDDDVLMLRYTLNGEDRIASCQVEWDDHALKQTSEEGLVLEHQKGTELPFLESTSLTAESLQRQVALFSKLAEGGYDG